jgi:N-acetylmuramoyl-L-alanine amidase
MIFNIHGGHNPDGKVACGAVGLIKESTEARKVKDEVMKLLQAKGHTVYDCTVDNGTSQNDVLHKIVTKCNVHKVDLDVSIHFNASMTKDLKGDGVNKGVEVCIYQSKSKSKDEAQAVVNEISKLGYHNRGIVLRPSLFYLKNTNAPALLIECCFADDKDDIKLYNYKTMAKAIVKGLLKQ